MNNASEIKTEELHKEIDLIQSCITRMTNSSFLLKGWAITLLAIVFSISDKEKNQILLALISLIPLIGFWILDTFFLRTEKKYRKLYDWVLEKRKKGDSSYQYNLNPKRFDNQVDGMGKTMFSITFRWFYGTQVLIVTTIIVYLLLK